MGLATCPGRGRVRPRRRCERPKVVLSFTSTLLRANGRHFTSVSKPVPRRTCLGFVFCRRQVWRALSSVHNAARGSPNFLLCRPRGVHGVEYFCRGVKAHFPVLGRISCITTYESSCPTRRNIKVYWDPLGSNSISYPYFFLTIRTGELRAPIAFRLRE